MSRRARFLAGLFTFLALTFSFAESVWASTCAPPMQMATSAPAAGDEASDGRHCGHNHDTHGTRGAGHPGDPGDSSEPCPFSSPVATQTCTGVVSLPARVEVTFAPFSESVRGIFTVDLRHDLLLHSTLFRPPRA